jgi:hypothetical protein
METLNTLENIPYNSLTGVTGIKALEIYTAAIEYKTIITETWTGNEQRRDQWTYPRYTWNLTFEKDPKYAREMQAFFMRQIGRKKAFQWTWNKYNSYGEDIGGDDQLYVVRFDTDKLEIDANYWGYKVFKVPIIRLFGEE